MSTRTTGRIVGVCILLAFLLYGGGTAPGDASTLTALAQVAQEGNQNAYRFSRAINRASADHSHRRSA